jgi:hypothetical protein
MKLHSQQRSRRVVPLRATLAPYLAGCLDNDCQGLPVSRLVFAEHGRATKDEWWLGKQQMLSRGGRFGVKQLLDPRRTPAMRERERKLSAVQICSAPGCTRRATRPCFDCGEWRCAEHLVAAVHHRKVAIVHLCPDCLHAYVNAPDRLRLDGFVDERAERAADPLAPRETRRDTISPIENNTLASLLERVPDAPAGRLERNLAPSTTRRTARRSSMLLDE